MSTLPPNKNKTIPKIPVTNQTNFYIYTVRANSYQTKLGVIARKLKEQENNERINNKIQGKLSLSLKFLLGVNGPGVYGP